MLVNRLSSWIDRGNVGNQSVMTDNAAPIQAWQQYYRRSVTGNDATYARRDMNCGAIWRNLSSEIRPLRVM